MKRHLLALALALGAATAAAAYPDHPIKLLVPSAAGGSVDKIARAIGRKLEQRMGQPVVIENRAGAGGTIATEATVRAPGDGYTLLMGTIAGLATNVSLTKIRYDPLRDLAPITLVGQQDFVLCVNASLPVQNMGELLQWGRQRKDGSSYASAGTGTGSHLSGELLGQLARLKLVHVPYKGMSQAMTDVIGGQVDLVFASTASAMPQIQAQQLRALAVTGTRRSPLLPNIPTVAEAGLRGYQSATWYGVVAPASTPKAIVDRLHDEIVGVLRDPEINQLFTDEGIEIAGGSPQDFHRFMASEIAKWKKVVAAAGIAEKN